MTDPISSTGATSTLAGLTLISIFPGIDAATVIGAFAGALVFICTTTELGNLRKSVLFFVSFIVGNLAADLAAGVLSTMLPNSIEVSKAVGALLASAIAVHLLQALLRKKPEDILKNVRKGS